MTALLDLAARMWPLLATAVARLVAVKLAVDPRPRVGGRR